MSFDLSPNLSDGVLLLSPIASADREPLRIAASDPLIWAGHPVKDRHKPAVFDPYFDFLSSSPGTLVARMADTDQVIGCSRYYVGEDAPDDIGIGFTFLIRRYWGGAMNLRMKTLMLDHAFKTFDAVWFHIGHDNIRSQKATVKLGGERVADAVANLAGKPENWVRYRLSKTAWSARGR